MPKEDMCNGLGDAFHARLKCTQFAPIRNCRLEGDGANSALVLNQVVSQCVHRRHRVQDASWNANTLEQTFHCTVVRWKQMQCRRSRLDQVRNDVSKCLDIPRWYLLYVFPRLGFGLWRSGEPPWPGLS